LKTMWGNNFIRWMLAGMMGFIFINVAFGQDRADSLREVLNRMHGTERLHPLNLLARELTEKNPDEALAYAVEAKSIAKSCDSIAELAFALQNLGDVFYYKEQFEKSRMYYDSALLLFRKTGDLRNIATNYYNISLIFQNDNDSDSALMYNNLALQYFDSINDQPNVSLILYNIGYIYDDLGKNIKALEYYKRSLKISDSLNDEYEIASTYNTIGLLYYDWGDFENALINYQHSLSMMEKLNDKKGMSQVLNNIGILYYDLGEKEKALENYKASMKLEKEIGKNSDLGSSYNNIGIIYSDMNENKKAMKYYLKSLELAKQHNDDAAIATAYNNIGELYSSEGKYLEAVKLLEKALAIERKNGIPEDLAIGYNTIGGFYHKMGKQAEALKYADSSIRLAQMINAPDIMKDDYLLFHKIYKSLGNYKTALDYYVKFHELRDSLYNENSYRKILNMQFKYEADKHEKELELLNSKNKLHLLELENKKIVLNRQRIVIHIAVGAFVIIFVVALLLYIQFRQKKKAIVLLDKKNKEIMEQRNEIIRAKEQAEESDRLKTIFLSNISHELRTPLNGILGFAEILQKELTDPVYQEMSEAIYYSGKRLLDTLNSIIDLSVIESNELELFITDINLVELIKERTLLFKVATSKKGLGITSRCESESINIISDPKLLTNLLNNLIDNAVKYTKEGGITIEAGTCNDDEKYAVWIKVADTGIGIPENRLEHIFDRFTQVSEGHNREYEGAGLGLTLCKKYIDVLQGKITVKSKLGEGSEFTIWLPFSIDETGRNEIF